MNRTPHSTLLVLSLFVGFSLLFATEVTTQSKKSFEGTGAAVVQQRPGSCRNLKNAPAIFGVTITDLDQAAAAAPYLQQLVAANGAVPVVVRVVFEPIEKSKETDFEERLARYERTVKELRDGSNVCVLGTIADSYDMHFYLPDSPNPRWPIGYRNYERWTERLVGKMGELVDIWEIGNEVNGEWYGWKGEDYKTDRQHMQPQYQRKRILKRERVKQELTLAYNKIRLLRPDGLTAITLLYNADQNSHHCVEFSEYEMNDWANQYLVRELRNGVDLVLLSYYENTQDCPQVGRSAEQLVLVLSALRKNLFTGEQTTFGFGEIGYKQTCYRTDKPEKEIDDEARVDNPVCQSGQQVYVDRYYESLDRDLRTALANYQPPAGIKPVRFMGGYFYWYFLQDMVLSGNAESDRVRTSLLAVRRTFGNPIQRPNGPDTPPLRTP